MALFSRSTFVLYFAWVVRISNSLFSDNEVSISNEEHVPDLLSKRLGDTDFFTTSRYDVFYCAYNYSHFYNHLYILFLLTIDFDRLNTCVIEWTCVCSGATFVTSDKKWDGYDISRFGFAFIYVNDLYSFDFSIK